jgi:Tfp pilus assembly protein PilV
MEVMRRPTEDYGDNFFYAQLGALIIMQHDHTDDNRREEDRRRAHAASRPPQLSGDACTTCGNFSLQRTGVCLTCIVCGTTTGCS